MLSKEAILLCFLFASNELLNLSTKTAHGWAVPLLPKRGPLTPPKIRRKKDRVSRGRVVAVAAVQDVWGRVDIVTHAKASDPWEWNRRLGITWTDPVPSTLENLNMGTWSHKENTTSPPSELRGPGRLHRSLPPESQQLLRSDGGGFRR